MYLVGEMTLLVTENLFYLYDNLDRNCISLCTTVVTLLKFFCSTKPLLFFKLYTAAMLNYLAKLNLGYVY